MNCITVARLFTTVPLSSCRCECRLCVGHNEEACLCVPGRVFAMAEVPRLTVIYSLGSIQTAYLGMSAGVEFCLDTRKPRIAGTRHHGKNRSF